MLKTSAYADANVMNTRAVIDTMVERIVHNFRPERIILFGSHARGVATPQSDVDLLVVFPTLPDKRRTTVAIRRTLADLPVSKDVVLTTPEEIEKHGQQIGSILRPALREGKLLYERR